MFLDPLGKVIQSSSRVPFYYSTYANCKVTQL